MVFERKEKGKKRECRRDGVSKHFFLGVLSEDGTSEKAEQWAGKLDAFVPRESSKMKNHVRGSLHNILRLTISDRS